MDNEAKRLSRALFRNAYVLSVSVAIAGFTDGKFTQRNIASKLQIQDNLVTQPLRKLFEADLIKPTPSGWERQESVFWSLITALYGEKVGPLQ